MDGASGLRFFNISFGWSRKEEIKVPELLITSLFVLGSYLVLSVYCTHKQLLKWYVYYLRCNHAASP
ncbi:hypothetical protein MAR_035908 [Mya arenaria]|uniref:Uncharacterized protein n=1 Tax=Mya arenaria TaxID=6604 RepID=A0ABY7EP49_MYAAR|nr:hypothetical protein MAR_035908 [Mya arenaria]